MGIEVDDEKSNFSDQRNLSYHVVELFIARSSGCGIRKSWKIAHTAKCNVDMMAADFL